MKKILFAIIFIFMLNVVLADDIEINLIEYHPDSYYTRLQIRNNAGSDLNDLIIKIGDGFETSSQGVFKDGANYNAVLNIPPGEHQVTVTTKEGVSSSKKVYFSLSKENVQLNLEAEQETKKLEQESKQTAAQNLEAVQRQLDAEREQAIGLGIVKESKSSFWIVLSIIVLVAGIIILFWLIKRGKNE